MFCTNQSSIILKNVNFYLPLPEKSIPTLINTKLFMIPKTNYALYYFKHDLSLPNTKSSVRLTIETLSLMRTQKSALIIKTPAPHKSLLLIKPLIFKRLDRKLMNIMSL